MIADILGLLQPIFLLLNYGREKSLNMEAMHILHSTLTFTAVNAYCITNFKISIQQFTPTVENVHIPCILSTRFRILCTHFYTQHILSNNLLTAKIT